MTLDLLNILVNVASCIALLLSVVFLLFVRYEYNKDARGFSQARHLMACVIFLGVIADTMAIVYLLQGSPIVMLTSFVFAATIFIQLLAGGYVGLLLFRSPQATLKNLILMVLPAVLITAMHICGVVAFKIDNPDVSHYYVAFLDTRFAVITTWFLHITSIMTLTVLGIYLIKCVRRYINVINAYYSGKDNIDAKKLVFIYHSYFFFFVSGCLNLLMRSALFNAAVVCVVSAYFVFFTIKLLNARPLFVAIAPAYDYEQGVLSAEEIDKKEENSANEVQTPQALFTSRPKVEELVSFWVNLSPAPYLGENLTLAKVSSQIGVSQRLLSDYLNNTLNLNFNAWINTLRIGEVKKILVNEKQASLLDVAVRTGFADQSAMSKVFKKITGESPTEFQVRNGE